jgi:hypothetical protein
MKAVLVARMCVGLSVGGPRKADPSADGKDLQGTWTVVSAEVRE